MSRPTKAPTPAIAPTLRCALYARVSTDKQVEKYGLDAQLYAVRRLATERGYTIVGEFVDDGVSGATLDRPKLNALRDLVRARAIDIVLAHATDRISRETVDYLLVLDEVQRYDARLEFSSHTPEDTAEGRLREEMLASFGRFERAKIRQRTKDGACQKARKGCSPNGRVPYGYRRDPSALAELAVEPVEAAIVQQIVAWAAEGVPVRTIGLRLDAQGVKTPGGARWARMTIRNMIWSDVYLGTGTYNRRDESKGSRKPHRTRDKSEWLQYPVTPIVDATLAQRARERLQRNKALKAARQGARVYLLGGVVVCGVCNKNRPMYGDSANRRSVYRCSGRHLDAASRCRFTMLASALEDAVWTSVVEKIRDPARLWRDAQDVGATRNDTETRLKELIVAIAKNSRKLESYQELYSDGEMSRVVYDRKKIPVIAEGKRLEHERRALEARLVAEQVNASEYAALVAYCQSVEDGLDRLDATQRRDFVRRLLGTDGRVIVDSDKVNFSGALDVDASPPPAPEPQPRGQVLKFARRSVSSFAREAGHCARQDSVPLAWSIPLAPRETDG